MGILKNRNKKQYRKSVDGVFSAVSYCPQTSKSSSLSGKTKNLFVTGVARTTRYFFQLSKAFKYKKLSASVLAVVLIFAIVFRDAPSIYGATYYWNQLGWSGGQTTNDAVHPGNQNGWNEFSSKDAYVKTVNGGGDVELEWTAGSSAQTSDTGLEDTHNVGGFNAGSHTNTKVQGAGTAAHVDLSFSGVASISAGQNFILAIKSDDTVWAWGENGSGQLGDKTLNHRYTPVQVMSGENYLNGIEMISAGSNHSLALKSDGTVWAWGTNGSGQLGDNSVTQANTAVQVVGPGGTGYLDDVIAVSAGENYSLALKSDGTVWAWGENGSGQLGNNTVVNASYPVQVVGAGGTGNISSIASVSAGRFHALALKSDGTVWAWGENSSGQLGNNTLVNAVYPVPVVGSGGVGNISSITSVSAGGYHSLALKLDGTILAWGKNEKGQLGNNTFTNMMTPVQVINSNGVGFLNSIASLATGFDFSLAVKSDGSAYSWGYNATGQLGNNNLTEQALPIKILDSGGVGNIANISLIDGGEGHTVTFKTDANGSVWTWGKNEKGQLGDNTENNVRTPIQTWGPASGNLEGITEMSSGLAHSLARKSDGTVWSWGWNGNGQLGDLYADYRLTPIQVSGSGGIGNLDNVDKVAAGNYHSLALKNDGTVWAWGYNSNGQLGNGTWSASTNYPLQVRDAPGTGYLSGIIAISAGEAYSMALKNDGTVWAWGNNGKGQLGNNSDVMTNLPVQVLGLGGLGFLDSVGSISAGSKYAVVVKNDGTVWAWGDNIEGQLGDASTTERWTPVQSTGISAVNKVSTGLSHTVALKSDGTVWAWGWNASGQLGIGSSTDKSTVPLQVMDSGGVGYMSGILNVATGSKHCLAVKNDGTVWAWGYNSNGQLGDNTTANRNLPVQTLDKDGSAGLTDVFFLAGGYTNSAAIKTDNSLIWDWGINSYGELGNNKTSTSLLPTAVWGPANGTLGIGKTIFNTAGNFVSAVVDTQSIRDYTTVDFNNTIPIGTSVKIDVRAGSSPVVDGSWTAWLNDVSSGSDISFFGARRFFQYRIAASTANAEITPAFNDISLNYYSFPSPGRLVSSQYNASDATNVLSKITWNEVLGSGTDINFQVRTAPDSSGVPGVWTPWMGPDGTMGSYFIDESGGETMPAVVKDGIGDQWIQYQAFLISDGVATPTLNDVTLQYVVNAPPEVQNVTVAQGSDGIVSVNYQVRDADTTFPSNVTPGEVIVDLQYCTANCALAGSEAWANATTISGDVGAGIAVQESTWNAYQLTWNAKIDYPETYNNASNFKVRLRANDSEGANNLGYGNSNGFELDTKNPTNISFSIDNNANKLSLATPVDNTAYQMIVSNFADFHDASYEAFSAAYDYPSLASDPATVHVRIKDAYGNYTTATETTPARLQNIVFYDISNNSTNEYRELVSWEVAGAFEVGAGFSKYNIWRSIDGINYTLVNSITDRNVNYYLDQGLSGVIEYYYKVTVEDIHGNINEFSDIVNDVPNGQGGASATPPIITNVSNPPVTITANGATITWDTDKLSNSTVGYSATAGNFATEVGVATLATTGHSVTLTGLMQNTPYYFRLKSADIDDNVGVDDNSGAGYTFTTLTSDITSPIISGESESGISARAATINWTTNEAATSFVEYSTSDGFSTGAVNGSYDLTTVHAVTLPSLLNPDTTYYYKIHTKDASGNEAVSAQRNFHTASLGDITAPVITNGPTTPFISHNWATVDWTTDEPATSYVEYGTTASYGNIFGNENLVGAHSVVLPNTLTPETTYHYRIKSEDAAGNETVSGDSTFVTLVDPQDIIAPTLTSGPSVSGTTATSATITWTTDELSDSKIGYSQSSGSFSLEQGNGTMTVSHSVTLVDLLPEAQYFYQIKAADSSGNIMLANNGGAGFEFTTGLGQQPIISNVTATENAYDNFTMVWDTDLDSDSFIEFGTTAGYGNAAGKYDSVKNHAINLHNLLPETTYYYRVRSTAEFEAVSGQYTFVTGAAPVAGVPIISAINVNPISHNGATINWATNIPGNSYVEYGTDTSYGRIYGSNTLTMAHSVALPTDLAADTTYYFLLHSTDAGANEGISGENSFATNPNPIPGTPLISAVNINPISHDSATVTWTTDIASNSYVEYGTDTGYGRTYGDENLALNHSVILPADLNPSTTYHFRVHSTDIAHNTGTSGDYSFATLAGADTINPLISNVSYLNLTESTVRITWDTDENTNSIVYLGASTNYSLISGDENATEQNHIVDVTGLFPATTYHFQVMSRDGSGNVSYSSDGVFTTLALVGAPQITSGPTENQIADVNAHIAWMTNQDSDSQVVYGTSATELIYSRLIQEQVLAHDVFLTGLTAQTQYFYKVFSVNAGAIAVESAVQSFTTAVDAEHNHTLLTKIEQVNASQKSTSAIVTFVTDQKALCFVEYRVDGQTYSGLKGEEEAYNTNHSVHLLDLAAKTKYFLKITCTDNLDTVVKYEPAEEFSFITTDVSGGDGDSDTTPPSISGIKTGKANTGDGILVSWSTDELSSSFVRYGLTEEFGSVAGDDLVSFDMTKYATSHEVIMNNLPANTKYYYSIVSADASGNIAQSAVSTLTTSSQASLSSIKIEAISLSEARVSWSTNAPSSSVVEFGTTTLYGQVRQDNALVKEHSITVSGLVPATVYHIRVKSKDADGKEYVSSDYTFTSKAPPTISGVQVSQITEHGATVSFSTSIATDAVIQYIDAKNPKNSGSQGLPELLIVHDIVLNNLAPGTVFAMKIKVRDGSGNEAQQEGTSFSTNKDETAPAIDQVRVESALAQNEKVQTIISWTTDEDATTKVVYREGKNGENTDLPTNDGISQAHIAVITNFKPGVIYFFNVKSTDKYGNEATSDTYATLTPKKKENIIQIIVNNFQEIFKWTNA